MPRTKNGILFAAIVLITATSQAHGQTNDSVPPIDTVQPKSMSRLIPGPASGQPFLPLIDDVIDHAFFHPATDSDEPTVIDCQLNAPLPPDSKSIGPNCDATGCHPSNATRGLVGSTGPIPLTVTPSIEIQCKCPFCDSCNDRTSICPTCANSSGSQCQEKSASSEDFRSLDKYCEDVATMLVTTLRGSQGNPKAQQRAIQTALKMVAEQADLANKLESEKIEESHQQSLKQILLEHVRKGQPSFVCDDKSLLEPIYATQFRNSKELKQLADVDQSILQSIFALEKKFASFNMMQRAKFSGAEVRRMLNSIEEQEKREQEVEKLQAELQVLDQRIRQLQANPVRPANYLEPIYMPAQPLRPIVNDNRR